MTRMIYCENCGMMMSSTSYRVLWIVLILLFIPGFILIYGVYCLCRSKRVCQNSKCRVRPFATMAECNSYYAAKLEKEHDREVAKLEKREEKKRLKAEREEQKKLE